MNQQAKKRESLWTLIIAPSVWAAHFLLCYITAAVWCAKVVGREGPLGGVTAAVGIYTALALVGIGYLGWRGYARMQTGAGKAPFATDSPRGRRRFIGFAIVLLSLLSAVAVVFTGLVVVFMNTCH